QVEGGCAGGDALPGGACGRCRGGDGDGGAACAEGGDVGGEERVCHRGLGGLGDVEDEVGGFPVGPDVFGPEAGAGGPLVGLPGGEPDEPVAADPAAADADASGDAGGVGGVEPEGSGEGGDVVGAWGVAAGWPAGASGHDASSCALLVACWRA